MMKKRFYLFLACLISIGQAIANDLVTVENVEVPQNSEAVINVECNFETQFKGFQFDVQLDGGLSLVLDEDDKPIGELGFTGTDHAVSSSKVSEGHYRFVIVSMSNKLLPTSGTLLKMKVTGAVDKLIGNNYNAVISAIEFTTVSTEVQTFSDILFTITIGAPIDTRVVLDEISTILPVAASGVDVRVNRTISASNWNTICLPFAMDENQVKEAFGDDVRLGDFTSWSSEEDGDGNIIAINVGFTEVTNIEANHPYIIKVSNNVSSFTVDGVDIDPETEPMVQVGKKNSERGWFYGTYVADTTVPEENLFLNGGNFWYSTGNTKMKAYRGYFEFRDVLDSYYNDASAPCINISMDGQTTSINNIEMTQACENSIFNLNGIRIEKADKKGVYIVNGKKRVIK